MVWQKSYNFSSEYFLVLKNTFLSLICSLPREPSLEVGRLVFFVLSLNGVFWLNVMGVLMLVGVLAISFKS